MKEIPSPPFYWSVEGGGGGGMYEFAFKFRFEDQFAASLV